MKSKTQSQRAAILGALLEGYTINPQQALTLYGCFRLAARIRDIRDDGYEVKTTMTDAGDGTKYATYSIES
jgi:hypothetical protein